MNMVRSMPALPIYAEANNCPTSGSRAEVVYIALRSEMTWSYFELSRSILACSIFESPLESWEMPSKMLSWLQAERSNRMTTPQRYSLHIIPPEYMHVFR